MNRIRHWTALGVGLVGAAAGLPVLAQRCEASSGPHQAVLVELYTSEGCNSCPPADRWLSSLKGRPDVLAAAFHVDYWDRLGWKDRFGSPVHSARQAAQQGSSGARFSYTPQVLVNGRDWRRWPALPAAAAAPVQVTLRREGPRIDVQAHATAATTLAPSRLAGWWAVLEDGHATAVKAGENAGVTLAHDHVVPRYGQLAALAGADARWTVELAPAGSPAARLLVVVTDAASGLPLQAVQLGC